MRQHHNQNLSPIDIDGMLLECIAPSQIMLSAWVRTFRFFDNEYVNHHILPDPGYDERKGVERVMLTYRPSLTEFEDWYLLRLLGFGPTAHGDHNNLRKCTMVTGNKTVSTEKQQFVDSL
ncbi:hypothetical protein KCU92_g146, partial [Aureobasidium melanogenum]